MRPTSVLIAAEPMASTYSVHTIQYPVLSVEFRALRTKDYVLPDLLAVCTLPQLQFGLVFPANLSFLPLVNAICLVIDRLHRGFLGAYGNTWIETPAFDRLTAESFAFDQMLVDSPGLATLYRSYWQGLHSLAPDVEGRASLPALLREAGVRTTLMTDDRGVGGHPLAIEFDEVVEIDPPWQSQMAAEGAYEETHLAQCFFQIIDWLQSRRRRSGSATLLPLVPPGESRRRRGMRRPNAANATGARATRRC